MYKVIFFLFILFLASSCFNKTRIVPEQDMINIMADLHLADGILEAKGMKKYHQYDSVYYHEYVYQKYGYTKAEFDSSIVYYIGEPEILKTIFKSVSEELQKQSAILSDSLAKKKKELKRENIWNIRSTWELPADGKHEKIEFEIPTKGKGKYTLSAKIKIFEDDKSDNPRINIYFYKNDSNNTYGTRQYFRHTFLNKDNEFASHLISNELTDTSFTHIKGQILGHTNIDNQSWFKHAIVEDIKLYFKPLDNVSQDTLSLK